MKIRILALASLVAALFAGTPPRLAAASLIVDGSFETGSPLPGGGGESLAIGSTAITGWTVVGTAGSGHDLIWLTNTNDSFGLSTPYGSYFLDLTGYTDTAPYTGVSQMIPTTIGAIYNLSFDLGVNQSNSLFSGPIGVTALAGGSAQNFTNYNPAGTGNIWQDFGYNFVATSTTTTISITGIQGFQYIGLDNVAVNLVPEPSTWALAVTGFGGVIVVARARARRMRTANAA